MDLDEALTTTRSVRRRLDATRPVPREVLLECVDLAAQAPTGGNRQRLRWIFVDDPSLRARIVDAFREPAIAQFEALRDDSPDSRTRRVYQSAIDLLRRLETIPVLGLPCMVGRRREPMTNAEAASFYGSAIPAIWSFQLALRSRGLGSVYTTVHLRQEREIAEIVGIPDDATQIALLPIAYTVGTQFKPAARLPARDITSFNGFAA